MFFSFFSLLGSPFRKKLMKALHAQHCGILKREFYPIKAQDTCMSNRRIAFKFNKKRLIVLSFVYNESVHTPQDNTSIIVHNASSRRYHLNRIFVVRNRSMEYHYTTNSRLFNNVIIYDRYLVKNWRIIRLTSPPFYSTGYSEQSY